MLQAFQRRAQTANLAQHKLELLVQRNAQKIVWNTEGMYALETVPITAKEFQSNDWFAFLIHSTLNSAMLRGHRLNNTTGFLPLCLYALRSISAPSNVPFFNYCVYRLSTSVFMCTHSFFFFAFLDCDFFHSKKKNLLFLVPLLFLQCLHHLYQHTFCSHCHNFFQTHTAC